MKKMIWMEKSWKQVPVGNDKPEAPEDNKNEKELPKCPTFIPSSLFMLEDSPELFKHLEEFERGLINPADIKPEYLSLLGVNPFVERAIETIYNSGNFTLGILTNNGFWSKEKTTFIIEPDPRFKFVIESCRIGQRKPDASFYEAFY
uniref:DUF3825 domain-containing protein n=1 Tax=Meloidogyne hapla TaxID=6305 RepID=A0A1I8BEJ3_MELHA